MITRRAALSGLVALPLVPSVLGERLIPWETRLILAARQQIGVTLSYDPAYVSLDYPNGDVPRARGVCTDVVVRAYRDAFDFDLQTAVHEDMAAAFSAYPKIWGLTTTGAFQTWRPISGVTAPGIRCRAPSRTGRRVTSIRCA